MQLVFFLTFPVFGKKTSHLTLERNDLRSFYAALSLRTCLRMQFLICVLSAALQKFASGDENSHSSTCTVKEGGEPSHTRAGGAISSPLELRDNQGNTLLHVVHFEVDVGDEEDDEDEEGSDFGDEEESALHKRKLRDSSSKKKKNSVSRDKREDGGTSDCDKVSNGAAVGLSSFSRNSLEKDST